MPILALQPDPTAGNDTYLTNLSGSEARNFGISTAMAVGIDSVLGVIYKSLIKFDLSTLPTGTTVNSATLTLVCHNEISTTDLNISIHRSLVQWYEGSKNNAAPDASQDGSTWNLRNANGAVAWAGGAGGASGSDYAATASDTEAIVSTGTYVFTVTTDVQNFLSGSQTNHGWWLISPTDVANTRKDFRASDYLTDTSVRPILTIDYDNYVSGSITGTSTVVGDIIGIAGMGGSAAGVSSLIGRLISNQDIRGTIAGTSTTTGRIRAKEYANGVVTGTSTTSADIQGEADISGSIAGTSTAVGNPIGKFRVEGVATGTSTASVIPSFEGQLRGTAAGIASVVGIMWGKATGVARVIGCNTTPFLYITDGSIKNNGQLNILDFLSEGSGFKLQSWRPQISQYKARFSEGPLAQGRRLRYRNFDNVIETFELSAKSGDQDALILLQQELLAWQEAAANYWVSDFVFNPVYLVAKAARETYSRYAIIHMISVPELENPYQQPFYSLDHAALVAVTPKIERGHWLSTPPGQFECVAISSVRSWTVSGWETGT